MYKRKDEIDYCETFTQYDEFEEHDLVVIGNCLKEKREELNLTIEQMAEIVNVKTKRLIEIERGRKNYKISLFLFLRICEKLHINAVEFFAHIVNTLPSEY